MLLPPLPWCRKGSRPYAPLRSLGLVLLGFVHLDEAGGQSPALPHQPCVYIGAVRQLAYRERPPVPVFGSLVAAQLTSANKASQLARGGLPAGPGFSVGIRAGLIRLRRIDALQANMDVRNDDGIAVDNPRF